MNGLRLSLALSSMLGVLAAAPAAAASFLFTYNGVDAQDGRIRFTASGTLITTDTTSRIDGRDAFTVTGIGGQRNGVAITGLAPLFPSADGGADNLLFLTPSNFTNFGVSFSLANGTFANLFSGFDDGLNREISDDEITGTDSRFGFISFSIVPTPAAAVPEPATWAMMLLGFGAVGTAMRRRNGRATMRMRFA